MMFVASTQTLEQTIEFGNQQYESQEYESAIVAYSRAIFFDDGSHLVEIHDKLANSYFALKDFPKAAFNYDIVSRLSNNQEHINKYVFKSTNCLILQKQYLDAMQLVYSIQSDNQKTEYKKNFYLGTIYFGMEDFEEAEKYFLLSVDSVDKTALKQIGAIFDDKKSFNRPNPVAAKVMSIIIPGLGQFYSGSIQDGFNSLILTGGLITLMAIVTKNYGVVDGIVSILPWYQRYFQGGYVKAENLAIAKRQQRRSNKYKEIIKIVAQ